MPSPAETWMEEGFQQGMQQGMQQGLLRRAREDIVEILEARFGVVPQEISAATNELSDLSFLKALLKHAALGKNLDEFLQDLKKSRN
ncbi:MAG: hypothetical protein HQK56_17180 [Deltaproteobacteria bacterium]|nr:hypothetical protein [Deltaproteobacteria bacterium]